MNNPLRLDSISQNLADAFRQAGELQRRRAASAAAQIAASRTGLRGSEVESALEILHRGGDGSAVRPNLEALSADLDDQYFRLGEAEDEESGEASPEALRLFRKARAAAALAFALSPDTEQLHEAVYEAIIASEDRAETIRSADTALHGT